MMKKCVLFIACTLLVFMAGNEVSAERHGHKGHPRVAVGGEPVISCNEEIGGIMDIFNYPDTEITEVELAEDGTVIDPNAGPMPEHCVVKGEMNGGRIGLDGKIYGIKFEMRLPTEWTGRYFYQANGGVDGNVARAYGNILGGGPTSNGIIKGFAVISSDAGHPTRSADFGLDPQARLDYGYNAVAELTPMAKELIKTYYGKRPDKSYIVGSSNGGRHAMVAASRYADLYDGFLAGAPGFNLPQAAVAQLWGVQQYATISENGNGSGGGGFCGDVPLERPDISTSFSAEDTELVSDNIIAKCDTLDDALDNWVGDPLGCQELFSINEDLPTCTGMSDTDCLTYGQKSVLARVHNGAMNSFGEALYANFIWDPGIRSEAWRAWKFCNSTSNRRDPVAVGYIFTTPPQYPLDGITDLEYALNWNGTGFDVDQDAPLIYATDDTYTEAAMSFMTPPDLLMKKLRAKKGKLIVVHGSADPVFSVADTVNWYEALSAHHKKHTKKFARLFIVPGMSHSRGGPACDQFDLVDALVDWVEKGIKPDAITATARGGSNPGDNEEVPLTWDPNRTRPLCAYPAVPVYNGSGDIEDASNFSCVIP